MKKILLAFFLMLGSLSLSAQEKPKLTATSSEQKADEIVQKLNASVSLTEEQLPKVQSISVDRINNNTAAYKKIGPNDRARLSAATKMNLTEWETKLKEILTAEQYAQYLKGI